MFVPKAGRILGLGIFALAFSACSLSTPVPGSLPEHTVNDYWQDDEATNISYFIVADKSLAEDEARSIIEHYQNEEEGYKLINIWIFCDPTYAEQRYLNEALATDEKFYSYVMYRYQAGEWSTEGTVFQSKANKAHPAFGSACQ